MTLYITGLNGSIHNGLGKYLLDNDLIDAYIELKGSFNKLLFINQIRAIRRKINLDSPIKIIAVSYGAFCSRT